jgi:hypothetical protein
VANALREEIAELFRDEQIASTNNFHVMEVQDFLQLARDTRSPLVEVESQIAGKVQVYSIEHAARAESLLGEMFTIHDSQWLTSRPSRPPILLLTIVIPPQAMPEGWRDRDDVPRMFELEVETVDAPTPSTSGLRVFPNDSVEPVPLIMMGGGIKGLAYVGAIEELSKYYRFNWFVGTSAGAITAVLLGAGYTPGELQDLMAKKNFRDFFDASVPGAALNCLRYGGCFKADAFTEWIDVLLAEKLRSKKRVRLSDLPHRVTVYACRRGKRSLMFDSKEADADAAHAARCSMSIPYVFTPQFDQGIQTYDGGIHQNYPVEQFLLSYPNKSFVSLFLGTEHYEPVVGRSVFWDLISIVTEGSDADSVTKYRDQTVIIDTRPIGFLDFSLKEDEKQLLVACGRAGALSHICRDGEAHQQATKDRDALRVKVQAARNVAKRWFRVKVAVVVALIAFSYVGWRFWF